MNAGPVLLWFSVGMACIAGLTWFFSDRPRLFVRTFVPKGELREAKGELREALRQILRNPNFGRSMRAIAVLQLGVSALIGLVGLWLLIRS